MNRMTRDYCSKNYHPRWRFWEAKYNMETVNWKRLGNFCSNCGEELTEVTGSGSPVTNEVIKIRILGGSTNTFSTSIQSRWKKIFKNREKMAILKRKLLKKKRL